MAVTKKDTEFPKIDFGKIKQAKYIKLGEKGCWENLCLNDGTLRLGYNEVPGDFHPDKGKDVITNIYLPSGKKNEGAANNHARQVMDFYTTGPETIWITFSGDRMWWCVARSDVEFLGNDKSIYTNGSRLKRTLIPWSDKSISGKTLNIHDLSGRLTKTAAYRATICAIQGDEFDYLMRILKDEEHPEITETQKYKRQLEASIAALIKRLTWQDFELLVDLVFANSGWRRINSVGGTQKTIDIEMELPVTRERASVQVKSSTDKNQFQEYLQRFKDLQVSKCFYVYHSCTSSIESEDEHVIVIGPDELAKNVLCAGLVDWLMEKAG